MAKDQQNKHSNIRVKNIIEYGINCTPKLKIKVLLKKNIMEKMSETFQIALGMAKYNKPEAIRMFEEDLQNFPDNIAAYNNIGQCKLELAIEAKDEKMLKESIDILTKGIELIEGKGYSRPSTIDFTLERAKATKF